MTEGIEWGENVRGRWSTVLGEWIEVPIPARRIEARSDETRNAAQPAGREPGPKGRAQRRSR